MALSPIVKLNRKKTTRGTKMFFLSIYAHSRSNPQSEILPVYILYVAFAMLARLLENTFGWVSYLVLYVSVSAFSIT